MKIFLITRLGYLISAPRTVIYLMAKEVHGLENYARQWKENPGPGENIKK